MIECFLEDMDAGARLLASYVANITQLLPLGWTMQRWQSTAFEKRSIFRMQLIGARLHEE